MDIKMSGNDTKAVLKECSAGARMAIESIDGMTESVENRELKQIIVDCRRDHESLGAKAEQLLSEMGEDGKNAPPIARAMSWMKVNVKMNGDEPDPGAAAITYDGCAMGIKTLAKCMNKSPNADGGAMDIANRIIKCEQETMVNVRRFL